MGFLHGNITLAYFVFLRDQSSALSLNVDFFRTFGFRPVLMGAFLVGQVRHTSQRSSTLVTFRRPNIGREHSLPFFIEFDRQHYNGDSHKSWNRLCVKYVLSKTGLILKTVATFVLKAGLIWQQRGFLLGYSVYKM